MTLKVRAAEPAVEAELSVVPAFLPERDAWRFCVTPKEIYRSFEPQLSALSPTTRRLEFDVKCTDRADSSQLATLQTAYTVRVRELRYPGRPADAVDAAGKWVYVFRDGTLVVEAHCIKGNLWDGWTVAGASRQPWRSATGLRLDPGPSGHRFTYSYLLSPLKLCQDVVEDIENGRLELGAVECSCDCYDKYILLPDPLRWACDAQEQYYQPRSVGCGGFLVAQWLSLNAHEVFASRSFLGKHSQEIGAKVNWSRDPLPSQDAKAEASVLVDLLCQFRLSCFAGLDDWRVFINPDYLEDGSKFEVQVANRWANAHPENFSLVVDLDLDEVHQTAGPPLKPGEVRRDASGQVEYILINTEAAQPRINRLRQYRDTSVRVRLMHYEEGKKPAQRVPKLEDFAVEIRLPSSDHVFSLVPSTWVQADSSTKDPK